MGTHPHFLLLPFASTPTKLSFLPLENPNNTKWRRCGLRNARGPPDFGYSPEDGYCYFGSASSSSSSSSKHRTWWSDDADYDDDDDDGEDDYWDFHDGADEFRIFSQVIRALGWMLPAIATWLVFGTDTNSFFMALAVPLGQTALSLLVDKVWASADGSSPRGRRRNKTRKKPIPIAASGRKRSDVKQETKNGKGTRSYQSWMPGSGRKRSGVKREMKNGERIGSYQSGMAGGDGSFKKGDKRSGNYGGWDELDGVS